MIRGLLRVLLYVGLGPFVGLFGASIAIGLGTLATTGSFRDFAGWDSLLSPQLLILAYTIGALPALLTAIVSIVIDRRVKDWPHWLWVSLSGALISCVLGWMVFGISPIGQGIQPLIFTVVFVGAGGLAAFVCAMVFDGLAALLGRR
jgi:hypothetical protein